MDLSNAQSNSSGQIAITHYMSTNPLVEIGHPATKAYKFVTKMCVCLAWVDAEDVEKILSILGGCCGGKKRIYRLSSAQEVRIWTGVADR